MEGEDRAELTPLLSILIKIPSNKRWIAH